MLRQEFLDWVGKMGKDKEMSFRVSSKGTILVQFAGGEREYRLTQAVCLYVYGVSKSDWNAAYELNLHGHTAANIYYSSVYPSRGILNWKRVRNTRRELFQLLGLSDARFYIGADRLARPVAA